MAGDDARAGQTDWEAWRVPGVVPALAAQTALLQQLLAAVQRSGGGAAAPAAVHDSQQGPPVLGYLQAPALPPPATAGRTRTIAEGTMLVDLATLDASANVNWGAFTAPVTGTATLWLTSSAGSRLALTADTTTADLLGGQPLPTGIWMPVDFPIQRGARYSFQVLTAATVTFLVMLGAGGASGGGAVALAPLPTHLPVPTFHTIGTTAAAIVLSTYTTAVPSSAELWNRGSTDLYINFNGTTATGDGSTSTDMHLAANETWSGNVQVTQVSVISSAAGGLFECQFWGP